MFALTSLLAFCVAAAATAAPAPATQPSAKPWTRWWWPGNAVDKQNLTRQLEQFAQAGFGGVEVTPIYGVQGADDREIEFLSPRYMEMLAHAATEAKRLGLQLDMATGTGWPFGGPTIQPADADAKLIRDGDKMLTTPTRMKVKRAAPGGAGLVVNPFSPSAMNHYLAWFDGPFEKFPRNPVRSQFHDSFEYSGNSTDALPERFRQMHGYDLGEHAAELFGEGDRDKVARVKRDYRATLNELHLEYVRAWVEWCHKNGWLARNQGHGAPANLLDLYALVDIPETETFGSANFPIPGFRRDQRDIGKDAPQPLMARFASSAAHVAGKPLASSETFTWLREHFRSSMSMMKPQLDQIFLCGINHVIFHGTCYSPADAAWPGWQFYASVEFQPHLPIWRDLPAMNAYIERVQAALQSGRPDNDVLLYWPIEDLWSRPSGMEVRLTMHSTDALLESEFGKTAEDLIARGYAVDFISDAQLQQAKRDGDAIVTSGGGRYHALVIPKCEHLPPATKKKIDELTRGGDFSIDSPAVRREAIADQKIGFIRRAFEIGHLYFLANLSDRPLDDWVPLDQMTTAVLIVDPLTGYTGLAQTRDGRIRLQLEPGESLIVTSAEIPAKTPWRYRSRAGDAQRIDGTWTVTFVEGGPSLPSPLKLDKLVSWTDDGGEETKSFAGTARYRIEFDHAPQAQATDYLLDLGDVRESARVILNGQPVATLWSLPFRVGVGKHLTPGKNVLEIEVTNLAANRVRDLDRRGVKWRIMKEINFVSIAYKPFDASNWELTPSGLLGPVTLTPLRDTTDVAHD
jgi:alpha-L-rhamnosidase